MVNTVSKVTIFAVITIIFSVLDASALYQMSEGDRETDGVCLNKITEISSDIHFEKTEKMQYERLVVSGQSSNGTSPSGFKESKNLSKKEDKFALARFEALKYYAQIALITGKELCGKRYFLKDDTSKLDYTQYFVRDKKD